MSETEVTYYKGMLDGVMRCCHAMGELVKASTDRKDLDVKVMLGKTSEQMLKFSETIEGKLKTVEQRRMN